MHNFQTYPIDMLEFNPFTKIGKEWALVTTNADTKDNTMTISWGGAGVMWGKNVVYVFIRDTRYTKEFIDKNEFFSISFLDETYRQALNYCGAHSGRDEDKIANAGLNSNHKMDIPFIDESNLVLLCHKLSATRITEDSFLSPDIKEKWYPDDNMHTMYIAEIMEVLAR
ncbi:MAG: flavin reductase family protein [Roseburia sp.]|nr:flavin reductase family protein [Roseburia sp.]